jgi:hypothetical protein
MAAPDRSSGFYNFIIASTAETDGNPVAADGGFVLRRLGPLGVHTRPRTSTGGCRGTKTFDRGWAGNGILSGLGGVRMTRTQMTGIGLAGALLVARRPHRHRPEGGAPQPVADAVRSALGRRQEEHPGVRGVHAGSEIHLSSPVDTVRTFGQLIGHVAGANYVFCAAAKGEKSPQAEAAFESLATKAHSSRRGTSQ